MIQLTFDPVGHLLLVLLAALVLLPLLAIGPARSKTTPRKRMALSGIRLAVVLLALLAMLRPTIVHTETKKQSATLVLLFDWSKSMSVADAYAGNTRWQALKSAVTTALPVLAELAEDFEVKLYTFDAEPKPLDFDSRTLELPEEPEGKETAIGFALEQVIQREAGKRLAGVILLSDGAQRAFAPRDTPPQTPARLLSDWGYPLHTFAFGQSRGLENARDIALRDFVLADPTVFVKNQMTALGNLQVDGYTNQALPIELLFETSPGKMEVVARAQAQTRADGGRIPIELAYVPQVPGEYKVTLRATPQPGELVTTNNELSTFVTVLKGGLNVLFVEGAPRAEQAFVHRSLDGSPNMQVDFVGINPLAVGREPPNLADQFAPGKYDVYILGDVHAATFVGRGENLANSLALRNLRESVTNGAGLIMIGGLQNFGPGNYGATPLADILPVEMSRLERQNLGDPPRPDTQLSRPLKIKPTQLGEQHYVLRLAGDASQSRDLWQQLPPLEGGNRFSGLKPRGLVLAQSDGQAPVPLLVAQDIGAGRTMAFAGDSTWRWWLKGHETAHKRFWRQLVLWLAHKDESTEGSVWVKLDPRRYSPGQRVDFTAGAQTAEGAPVEGARFDVEVVLPDGSQRPLRTVNQGAEVQGSFLDAHAPGDYTLVVKATRDAEELGTARARFLVYQQDLELDNSAADPSTLASLAKMTGGESLAPEQLTSLLRRIKAQPMELEQGPPKKTELWDDWPFFSLFVGLLCVEWYLRKKWGLA
jgi:uncharacterized membrane protein